MLMGNRHVVLALVVAPFLAALAWYGVGNLIGEQPAPATPGASYPLVAQSDCRYASGSCTLRNADLSLALAISDDAAPTLSLLASHPLESVFFGLARDEGEPPAEPMRAADAIGRAWTLTLEEKPTGQQRLRLVAASRGSFYYGEVGTAFADGQLRGG